MPAYVRLNVREGGEMLQTELHRHLDVCTRPSTLFELAREQGLIAQSTPLDRFCRRVLLTEPMSTLREVLTRFEIFQRVLSSPEVLERVAFEAVEDCALEGTHQVELRYAPTFVSEYSGLTWDDVLVAFERGIAAARQQYPHIEVGLLCIAARDYGLEGVEETVAFCLRHRERFVGFDLAGNEEGFPCRHFEAAFKPLRDARVPITVHSGEACGPENIWEAIDLLGARRIGHGITALEDPLLVEALRTRQICLEQCPTSNWITRSVASLEAHPLPRLLRAGVPVTINTDDPGIFARTLPQELELARTHLGLSEDEVQRCLAYAETHRFIPG